MSHTRRGRGTSPLRAGGGVLRRHGPGGDLEVALIHRPRFDDWSLPKGKLKRAEHPIAGAAREVREETGVRPSVGARLPTVGYDVWVGDAMVEKVVDYWAMTVATDLGFTPGAEIDALCWLPVGDALARLTYTHDAKVLTAFSERPPLRRPVVLVRHAWAGDKGSLPGPHADRPLSHAGARRATKLAAPLACFTPARLVAASSRRCAQTLEPLGAMLTLRVEVDEAFDETADPDAAAQALHRLGSEAESSIVCSQAGIIAPALAALAGGAAKDYTTAKGSGWVLSFGDTGLAALDQLD